MQFELGFMRHNLKTPEETQKIIDWCMANNIRHFESCYFYLDFQCEEFLYDKLKKYPRESYTICGKMPVKNLMQTKGYLSIYQEQLARVPGGYFDTYLLQAVDETVFLSIMEQECIPFFLKEKELGHIKRFGLSIQCLSQFFHILLQLGCWDVIQMPLNYYDWFLCDYEQNYLLAEKFHLPIIAQAPMKGGLLAKSPLLPEEIDGVSRVQFAYDFFEGLDQVELMLLGGSSLESIKAAVFAYQNRKSHDLEQYKKIISDYVNKAQINCIACQRCEKICPQHIPISAFFRQYNEGLKDLNQFYALDRFKKSLDEPCNICTYCNKCLSVCPTKNDIPKKLLEVFELRS